MSKESCSTPTKKKCATQDLLKKLSAVVEQTADSVMITDHRGVVEYVNPAFQLLSGYSAHEVVGLKPNLLKSGKENPKTYKKLWDTILAGGVYRDVLINRKKNGDLFYTQKTITPLRDENQKITHFVSTDRDITERMMYEAQLAQVNAELKKFSYVVSHDLSEPLRTISSYCELLEKRCGDYLDEITKTYFRYIISATKRMRLLIDDLLIYAQAGKVTTAPEIIDCNEIVREVVSNLQATRDATKATITFDRLPSLTGNKNQILQIFQNLIGNAIKYHGPALPVVEIHSEDRGTEWLFTITDNGIGIPGDSTEQIFTAFTRLHSKDKFEGTGIGLSICRKIVEQYGGKIWAESQEKLGSKFFFTLPKSIESFN